MHLVNIFEKIIWWSKMFLSMRSSKYHLMTICSPLKYFGLIFTPPNSFIQWVYFICWVISKFMMKNWMINLEIIIINTKSIQKHWKWLKRMHFVDVKKVYFHRMLLDEWKWMNWWILINFIQFLCSFNLNAFCKNWKIDQNWMIRDILHIHLIRVSIFSDFNTHFHYKQ